MQKSKSEILEQLYRKYRFLMYDTAVKIVKDNQLAEASIYETFVKLTKYDFQIADIDSKQTKNLMVIMARYAAFDIDKKNKQNNSSFEEDTVETAGPGFSPTALIVSEDTVESMKTMLLEMDDKYTDTLYLKYYCGYSNEKAAAILCISEDLLQMRLKKAIELLVTKNSLTGGLQPHP